MNLRTGHLFRDAGPTDDAESVEAFLDVSSRQVRVERIVSTGQASPEGFWYDQESAEWVPLLSGSAVLRFQGREELLEMNPGDWVLIPPHCRHRVEETDPTGPTVWLAVHSYPEGA